MSAAMDYRPLVPREPPAGLREWTLKNFGPELERCGLVYEVKYVEDYGLLQILDEWAEPRKIKMVRVTCSCCGKSTLLHWGKDPTRGYGFIMPEDLEGDWGHTVIAAGEESVCPICEQRVLVNKRSAVRDYYTTAECTVMSADVLEDGELVLTGWTVQCRTYKSGAYGLKFLPSEAYVFTQTDCAQLMGWRNGYGGTAGCFIQYGPWRQPVQWKERWGQEEQIFGLTPELVDRSCLPNCKLDVYMAPRPGMKHYPVAYLRLYQQHPNVESVLVHGLPCVLGDLIAAKVTAPDWEKNNRGRMALPQIDWAETRPAQMLRLTKEELRMAQDQYWGLMFWELFTATKRIGERLRSEDIRNAFCLGDEHLTELIPRGQVAKSIRYLLRQCEALASEVDDADADPIPDAMLLRDYWNMVEILGRNLSDPSVKYPADLITAHDRATELMKQKDADDMANLFRIRRRLLKKYIFAAHGLIIRPAASQRELTEEGDALHHCVGTYGKKHATGKSAIFFIRWVDRPKEPYFALELDEKTLTVLQNRGKNNCARTPEVEAFEKEWLAWVRAGAPKGQPGRPVSKQPVKKTKRKKEAA